MIEIGKSDNRIVSLDLATLIDTRLLIQSNSGGGKSYAIRRLLETSYGLVQQIVLDLEGEFATLREKFDYIIAGKGGDIPADPRTANLLARRLLELGVSAICDLYELKAHDRIRFVRLFLEALMNVPRSLWKPVLVIVDEAHFFCPEKGQAESHQAIIDLCTRGRKRGFCGVLATQRLSKLHKDACAELLNKMIGRTSLDIDQTRAADELGMRGKDSRIALRNLHPGEFHIYGPALHIGGKHSNDVIRFKVGQVRTTHPKVGARRIEAPPAPTAKIKKILASLADLPGEAEHEAQDLASLKSLNAELRRKLTMAEKGQPVIKPCDHAPLIKELQEKEKQYQIIIKNAIRSLKGMESAMVKTGQGIAETVANLSQASEDMRLPVPTRIQPRQSINPKESVKPRRSIPAATSAPTALNDGDLSQPQQRILDVLATFESIGVGSLHKNILAVFSGASPTSGGYFNNLGKLRNSLGLIEYPSSSYVILTDSGRQKARPGENIATLQSLHDAWYRTITPPQAKILAALIKIYPEDIEKVELAERIGVSGTSGGYFNNLGRLRTIGAIDYPTPGRVMATDLLFPEALK